MTPNIECDYRHCPTPEQVPERTLHIQDTAGDTLLILFYHASCLAGLYDRFVRTILAWESET